MTKDGTRLEHLLADSQGVIALRDLGEGRELVRSAVRRGALAAVLPGVYVAASSLDDVQVRIRALLKYAPSTILCGRTAAGLLWRPELLQGDVEAIGRLKGNPRGFRVRQGYVDPQWIVYVGDVACTAPELTALDLVPDMGADLIDDLLRRAKDNGAEQLERLWQALRDHPAKPGNWLKERVLRESRDRPWSEAERRAHTLLREAQVTGWVTNHRVVVSQVERFLDIAFCRERLALEIDGYETHGTRRAFESDRERNNALTLAGWTTLHFTWAMVTERPAYFIETVRQALAPNITAPAADRSR